MTRLLPGQRARIDAAIAEEAQRCLTYLASCPSGITSATSKVVRRIMLDTSGHLLAHGRLYDIIAKPLGGGVSRLTLREVRP